MRSLNMISPMPPKKNGIADYAYNISKELSNYYPTRIVTNDLAAHIPSNSYLFDYKTMFKYARDSDINLYQIGNNPDHSFVLDILRDFGGVVSLHDLHLLYLYEITGSLNSCSSVLLKDINPQVGKIWSLHHRMGLGGDKTRHLMLDCLSEILSISKSIIVHSEFARKKIRLAYSGKYDSKIHVVPHYAPDVQKYDRIKSRHDLGLSDDDVLILTSGFATAAKRFDWVIQSLAKVRQTGGSFIWVHAGEERPEEFDLTSSINQYEDLRQYARVTGYLTEVQLDSYIAASDIMINLRFPSVGESSGTLVRGLAAGACCIISDTAAYSEFPYTCVVRVPPIACVDGLSCAITQLLEDKELRVQIGANARQFAHENLNISMIGALYKKVLDTENAFECHDTADVDLNLQDQPYIDLTHIDNGATDRMRTIFNNLRRSGVIRCLFANIDSAVTELRSGTLYKVALEHGVEISDVSFHSSREHEGEHCEISLRAKVGWV